MLRFSGSFGLLNTEYESVGQLDGRYVGTSLRITDSGKPLITAHLLEGSLLPAGAESAFTPPADAVPCPNPAPATAKPELIAGHKLSGSPPSYPASARRNHVEGKVILSALIGEDGRIHQLEIVSAPDPSLAISALTAVRDWIYRPYQLNGAPVRVSTQINVDYALN
jgi:TonB family protein